MHLFESDMTLLTESDSLNPYTFDMAHLSGVSLSYNFRKEKLNLNLIEGI